MKKNSTHYTLHSTLDKTLDKPVLLISASDSSAAAGMQVDLRVLDDLGVPARCAITAVTVQGDGGARSINPVAPEILLEAVDTALTDQPGIGAVKIGLLGDERTVRILDGPLAAMKSRKIPIIVDPVMRSTPGSPLTTGDAAAAILEIVLPRATLLTPNHDEMGAIGDLTGAGDQDVAGKAVRILERGVAGILVTGGDTGEAVCTDALYEQGGAHTVFRHPKIGVKAPRGTGCALSTAIAVQMARGLPMRAAVERAIDYVTGLIGRAAAVGDQLLLFPGKKP